jgi:hypothetical protein
VADLLEEQGLAADFAGQRVVVSCRELSSGSPSFADELVSELLDHRHASEVLLVSCPPKFRNYMLEAASRHGRQDAVVVARGEDVFA